MSGMELATVLTATFGAFGSILYGFYKYAQTREKEFEKSRQLASRTYERSTDSLIKSLDRVATATERSADEAKQRNGHLAELQLKSQNLILAHNKDVDVLSKKVIDAVSNIKEQHVDHQTVDRADIKANRKQSKEL